MIPQLRIRTEYSYKQCYGPIPDIAETLERLECKIAGIVDTHGTWGHVNWEKALTKRGIKPLFGTEFTIPTNDFSPRCWVLAEDIRAFYRLSSMNPTTEAQLAEAKGVIRFAGAALKDPASFDYIDINPRSIRQTMAALELAKKTKKPLVITPDNDYPSFTDRNKFLAWADSKKMTPQHILVEEELRQSMRHVDTRTFNKAIKNTYEVAERLQGLKLNIAPMISVPGDLTVLVEAGRKYRLEQGHIKEWNAEYQARLERELAMIKQKSFESYFIIVADMVVWAKQRMLVGPARGSSAGSLACYLLQITEVDPLVHNLIFERFIDINRNDLPDIDVDFNDTKRELVFDYLRTKYGAENVARIGSVSRLKPKSVMAHVSKKMDIPHGATFNVLNVLVEHPSGDARYGKSIEDTFIGTQPGKDFLYRYPEASLMADLENHASHSGQHAAGIIVSAQPAVEYCTVRDGIAHIDKKDSEALNLLKIDALGLRTLGIIEDSNCITPQELYNLTLDDPEVFAIFNAGKFSSVFQFEGAAQRRVSIQVPITSFKQIDHVTALARPGPLGGGATQTYIKRHSGKEETTFRHPSMESYLADTHGVVLYQEQVMRIVREVGGFSWEDTSIIRKAMSSSKGHEFFDKYKGQFIIGAHAVGMMPDVASDVWNEMCSFGAYGMNKSHTVSYAIISYWCAYMKRYHPIEYAAASLRNAKDDEQVIEILRDLRDEGINYIPFDPDLSAENWTAVDGELVGGFSNLVGIGPVKAAAYIEKRNKTGLSAADRKALATREVQFKDLTPAVTLWRDYYENPAAYNINGAVTQFKDMKDGENCVVICKLISNERRDENEAVRVSRRGGKMKPGQTLFLDSFVVDDSTSKPVRLRIKSNLWFSYGVKIAERSIPEKDWFLVRGKWLEQFSMFTVEKIRCLTNTEMFL